MRYLAGQALSIGGSIAVGTGAVAPAVSDLRLTHEFDRATIYLVSPDYINKRIIFKGSIDERTVGSIYEVGLFSAPHGSIRGGSPSKALATFERTTESWSAGTFASGNHRIGHEALRLAPAAAATVTADLPISLDLSAYGNEDVFSLAFHSLDANTSNVTLRFKGTDPATRYEFSVPIVTGYSVANFKKSALTKVGAVDWSLINSIELSVTAGAAAAAQVDFDGLRVEYSGLDEDNVLVSRTVLATPVSKVELSAMDIEYSLEVTL